VFRWKATQTAQIIVDPVGQPVDSGRLLQQGFTQDIREALDTCRISCNAGVVDVKMIGDFTGYPAPIRCYPDGIANILSLHLVKKHCRVQYDSVQERAAFHVTKPDGSVRDFRPSVIGLRYFDTLENATVLVKTVAEETLEDEDALHNANYVNGDPDPYPAGGVEDYNDCVDDTGSVGGVDDYSDSADDTGSEARNVSEEIEIFCRG
jgi:hypothetical protein